MAKPINILHPIPKGGKTAFAIIPIGMYLNRPLQDAAPNSEICFWQEWRHEKRVLVRKCKVAVNSPVFTFLAKSIYGERMTITKLFEQWESLAVVEGYGKEGFSRESCIILQVAPLEEEM